MTEAPALKATIQHQSETHRRSIALTDAPPVVTTSGEFTPTLITIGWSREWEQPWSLTDVRAIRREDGVTRDLVLYGNNLDAMPLWITGLIGVHHP